MTNDEELLLHPNSNCSTSTWFSYFTKLTIPNQIIRANGTRHASILAQAFVGGLSLYRLYAMRENHQAVLK